MEYVNARKGLGRLFTGTVFQIISRAMIEVSFLIMLIMNRIQIKDAEISFTNDMVATVLMIMGLGVALIAFILNFIGVCKASKDEKSFKGALAFIIIGVIVSFVSTALYDHRFFSIVLSVGSVICQFMVYQFIFNGIYDMSEKKGDEKLKNLSEKSVMPVMIAFILAAVITFVALLLEVGHEALYNSILTGAVVPVVMIVAYAFVLRTVDAARCAT